MGMFGRLKLIFHTEMNSALDALEDPKKGLDYGLLRLEENLREVRQSLVEIVSAQRMLLNRRDQVVNAAAHHEEQARVALAAGREDLAALALGRRQAALARQTELEAAAANLDGQAEGLKVTLSGLQTRIELLRSRKEELQAIYDSSRAQLRVREALTGLSADLDDVGHTLARAEDRIRQMQARAEAVDHLAAAGALIDVLNPAGDDIDRELGRLRMGTEVEADLARLKAETGQSYLTDGTSQASSGSPVS
jgi:phage shock protein A